MEQMKKMPLEGIRVVELATVVAAPTASRVLCAFGAEVIKVETKIGDAAQGLPRPRIRALFRLRPEGARRRQARL